MLVVIIQGTPTPLDTQKSPVMYDKNKVSMISNVSDAGECCIALRCFKIRQATTPKARPMSIAEDKNPKKYVGIIPVETIAT